MINISFADTGTLESVESLCWQMISEAVNDRNAGMHQVIVGTVRDGSPMTRMVVLRRVDRDTRKLYFHTDMRKELVSDILANGSMSWLAYDKSLRSQLRFFGRTIVHHKDALALEHWNKTRHFSRRCYLQPEAPGTTSDGSSYEEGLSNFAYTLEESEAGFENFAVVETEAEWMDWYFTYHRGNKRARFVYRSGALEDACWLHP